MKKPSVKPRAAKVLKESGFLPWRVLGTNEERLHAAVNKLPMILFAFDEDGIITLSEGRGLKAIGVKPGELVGRSVFDMYRARPDLLINIKRALAGESFTAIATLDGVLLETQFTPLHDVAGKFMGTIGVSIDITERERAEEALKQQKQEQQIILDSAPALIWYKDKENKILRCNRAAAESIGLTREQMEGRSTYDLYPEHAAKYHKDDLEVIKSGKPKIGIIEEYTVASGEKGWVRTDKVPYRDEHGSIIGVIVFAVDITDQKWAEDLLAGQKRVLEDIARGEPLLNILDSLCRVIENHSRGMLCSILLLEPEGKRLLHGAAPSLPEVYNKAIHGLLIGPKAGSCGTAAYHGKAVIVSDIAVDPLWKDFRDLGLAHGLRACWSTPIISSGGRVLGTFAMYYREPRTPDDYDRQLIEISTNLARVAIEREQSECELRASEERYRQMFENNPMPMFVYDLETLQYLSVNDAAIEHYGYARSEFLAMTVKEIRPAEDVPLLMRIISEDPKQSRRSGPLRHKKKDGTIIEIEAWSHWINFAGRNARVVMVNDVTDRKKAEQALLHSQKLESLGILAGGIAHDFNNLLMGVLGNSDLALQKLDSGSRIGIHLQQIKKASMRAAELCRQLLAYSGKGRLDVSFFDLNRMIRELTTLLELSIHKGVTLKLCLEEGLPHLLGDKVQIQQVIMNLVINSSEAIGEKQGQITIITKKLHIDRGYLPFSRFTPEPLEGDYILFEVKDNGCGMEAGTLLRIFDPFFTTKFTGRGLGLAAVLGIVKGHGGALKVDSEQGVGTTFNILFPSHSGEKAATSSQESSQPGNEDWQGRGTILVVDDEEAVRAVSELILPTLGFTALVAPDGFRACELLHAHRDEVAAVMLDLTMPKMDGVRAVQELRKIKPGIKVLLMSGYDEEEAVNRFTNEGFDCFLQKPFVRNQLRDKLRIALAGK